MYTTLLFIRMPKIELPKALLNPIIMSCNETYDKRTEYIEESIYELKSTRVFREY